MADLVERTSAEIATSIVDQLWLSTHEKAKARKLIAAALEAEASEGERRGLELVLNMQAPIDSMCMTYRHDFGLPKGMNSYGNGSSGMTERDRDALRLTMRQVWEHAVLHAIRALIPEAPVREGWQPMETAPKDGSRILVWFVHENARWSTDPVGEGWATAHDAHWTDHNGGGWVWHGVCGSPTHWRPLPAPPQDNGEG